MSQSTELLLLAVAIVILAVSVGLCVLIIDLIYPRLDPRVTYVAESSN